MKDVLWIAVDERDCDGAAADVARMLVAGGGAFAAVALEVDGAADHLEDAARSLSRQFQVAVVPLICAERLAREPDQVMQGVDALVRSGSLRTAAFGRAVMLVRANALRLPDARLIDALRARMPQGEMPMIGLINRLGMLVRCPPGYDFLAHWPPMQGSAPHDPRDMMIEFLRGAADDSPCAHSVLIGECGPGVVGSGGGPASALWRLWLESARRFVTNRGSEVVPYVFVRQGGAADQVCPRDLAVALRAAGRRGADTSLPADPVAIPQGGARARIAVIIHLYFPELWPDFLAVVEAMPEPVHLYVSTPFALRSAVAARIRRDRPDACVVGVRNRGRDVLPFLHVMRSIGVDRYEYVLKLHSKKSAHLEDENSGGRMLGGGESWRRNAIDELAGSTQRIARLLEALDTDPTVGLVASAGQLFDQTEWGGGTDALMHRLCADFGVSRSASHFPAGTMFWLRPRAIRRLFAGDPGRLDFEREAGQLDRTLHHTLERAFAHFAVCDGFRVVDSDTLTR